MAEHRSFEHFEPARLVDDDRTWVRCLEVDRLAAGLAVLLRDGDAIPLDVVHLDGRDVALVRPWRRLEVALGAGDAKSWETLKDSDSPCSDAGSNGHRQ